jgi:serine/threonine-protein phosphatase 5
VIDSLLPRLLSICSIDPNYIKAYYRRASANYALGKLKEALKDFEAVAKIVPRDTDASKKLKQCRKELKAEAFTLAIINDEAEATGPVWTHEQVDGIHVESTYDGPVLPDTKFMNSTTDHECDESGRLTYSQSENSPVTMEFVHEMINHFRNTKKLHRK